MLTSVQAAKKIGVHPTTLANWRMNGVGPKFTRKGRRVYYRAHDLRPFAGMGRPNRPGRVSHES